MTDHSTVTGGGGVALHMTRTGPEGAPPILLVHGFLFSHLCWSRLMSGPLAEEFRLCALDMRGHGMSGKPDRPEDYSDGALWAQDMAAAIAACGRPPLVVVWSYPGLMLGDYLRRHGDAQLAGVALVSALTGIGQRRPPTQEGTTSALFSSDLGASLPALRAFIGKCSPEPMPVRDLAEATACALMVPPAARLGMNMRQEDFLPDLARLTKPALVVHGRHDALVDPAEGRDAAAAIPGARLSMYDTGHMPFRDARARFEAELADFARAAFAAAT